MEQVKRKTNFASDTSLARDRSTVRLCFRWNTNLRVLLFSCFVVYRNVHIGPYVPYLYIELYIHLTVFRCTVDIFSGIGGVLEFCGLYAVLHTRIYLPGLPNTPLPIIDIHHHIYRITRDTRSLHVVSDA